jgi:Flp pilus assembly protein TadB
MNRRKKDLADDISMEVWMAATLGGHLALVAGCLALAGSMGWACAAGVAAGLLLRRVVMLLGGPALRWRTARKRELKRASEVRPAVAQGWARAGRNI